MRDRLIEKLTETFDEQYAKRMLITPQHTADSLLANGVVVLPCKVDDTVYYFSHRPLNLSVKENTVYEAKVIRIVTTSLGTSLVIQIHNEYGCTEIPDIRSWGISVFATKEEAEQKLKEGKG